MSQVEEMDAVTRNQDQPAPLGVPDGPAPDRSVPHRLTGALALLCLGILVAGVGLLAARLVTAPPAETEIAGYATSLMGRTRSQRLNARRAAEALDGAVIAPGAEFSFNRRVKSWSADRGYVKAPVSYEGELVRAFGGGVCQTSSTLYNAALLAGLPIIERHHHVFAPHYVTPGRDAAVAQYNIDLRFRNPYPWPVRLRANLRGDQLDIRIVAPRRPTESVRIATDLLERTEPERLTSVVSRPGGTSGRAYVRSPGLPGCRVVTWRIFSRGGRELRRERLSDDTYPAMNRVIAVTE